MLQKVRSNFGTVVAGVVALCIVIKLIRDIKCSAKMLATIGNLIMLFITVKKKSAANA